MANNEKDKMQEKSSNWKKWTAIGAIALSSFFGGNIQEAEAANPQYQNNEQKITAQKQNTIGAEKLTPAQECNRLANQIRALNTKIAQLGRQQIPLERSNNIDGINAIKAQMEPLYEQRKGLIEQLKQAKAKLEQQQMSTSQQQQVKDDRANFQESLKVAPRMSDDEYKRIYKEAVRSALSRGKKIVTITDPAWAKEYELRRQEAQRAEEQQNKQKTQQQSQER